MGLIAREIEARGIPTLSMTSALSITRSVAPPRAAFVDFPLGHTTGRPHQPSLQRRLLRDALRAFDVLKEPGAILPLPYEWDDDDAWKDGVMRPARAGEPGSDDPEAGGEAPADDRTPRHAAPQYQTEDDRSRAEAALAADGCRTCVFLE